MFAIIQPSEEGKCCGVNYQSISETIYTVTCDFRFMHSLFLFSLTPFLSWIFFELQHIFL